MATEKQIKELETIYNSIHDELLNKKQFELARKLSSIFYNYGYQNRLEGMEFIKNLYEL